MPGKSKQRFSPWFTRKAARKRRSALRSLMQRRALFESLESRLLLAHGRMATIAVPAIADVSVGQDGSGPGNFYVGYQPQEDAFLRFDVSSFRGDVSQAKVRLVPAAVHHSVETHTAYTVSDDKWSESDMTWGTRPAHDASPLASWTPAANTPVEFEVTTLVQ